VRVRANTRLPLDLRKTPRAEADARVAEVLGMVGLEGFAKAWPRELSGGMQMRVSLARALVTRPSLLLLDEPFGALDEFTRNKLDSDVRRLWAEQSMTVAFVTHSIYEAVFLSTRVVVMAARPGRVVADIDIDGPTLRDDDWRVSAPFLSYCRQLSELLTAAAQGRV
jgi:NitT/TauT family transport system ATP-binding protein